MTIRSVMAADSEAIAAVRELFEEYQRELGVDLCFQGFDEELRTLPGKYAPPTGELLLAFDEQQLPVACGALRDLGEEVAEIKRIYIRPPYRRRGHARLISERLIHTAQEMSYAKVRLDTLRRLPGALELYRSLGFQEIQPYNYNPEADIVYMELAVPTPE